MHVVAEAERVIAKDERYWVVEKVGEAAEVLLATTEAFANAVAHPHEPRSHLVDVGGSITDRAITVSVRDYGTWQGERTREGQGFGLVLMEALMDAVRVESVVDGTTVTMRRRLQMH